MPKSSECEKIHTSFTAKEKGFLCTCYLTGDLFGSLSLAHTLHQLSNEGHDVRTMISLMDISASTNSPTLLLSCQLFHNDFQINYTTSIIVLHSLNTIL